MHAAVLDSTLFQILSVVDCGPLTNPRNGGVSFSSTTFNSRATYTCDRGFVLSGQSVRTCQSDGEWSGRAPECKGKIPCSIMTDLCLKRQCMSQSQ